MLIDMREFEKMEMFKIKCPVCGSRNKVHTELMNKFNKFVGYSLKCCNCGNYNQFLLDHETNGKEHNLPYRQGKERCIQPSYCNKKDCPLHGTCNMEYNDVDFNDKKNHNLQSQNLDDCDNVSHIEIFHKSRFL
jgi:hypothetical protein